MAVRCADCTRRQHLKREASETRCAQTADASFSVSGAGDASPSNGDSLQRQRQRQLLRSLRGQGQRSLRGQGQRSLRGQGQRSLRGQGQLQRTHGTIVWQQALDRQHVDRRLVSPSYNASQVGAERSEAQHAGAEAPANGHPFETWRTVSLRAGSRRRGSGMRQQHGKQRSAASTRRERRS